MSYHSSVVEILKGRFGEAVLGDQVFREQLSVSVAPGSIVDVCRFCRDDERLRLDMLADLTAVDRTPRAPRFEVVYNLYSFPHNRRLRLKVPVAENGEMIVTAPAPGFIATPPEPRVSIWPAVPSV